MEVKRCRECMVETGDNYPDTFQILCFNCHMAKAHYRYCPQQSFILTQRRVYIIGTLSIEYDTSEYYHMTYIIVILYIWYAYRTTLIPGLSLHLRWLNLQKSKGTIKY